MQFLCLLLLFTIDVCFVCVFACFAIHFVSLTHFCGSFGCFVCSLHAVQPYGPVVSKPRPGFLLLCDMFEQALSTAWVFRKFSIVRNLMNMSNTFYAESVRPANPNKAYKEYVMDRIRDHNMWSCMEVWDEIFFDALTAEQNLHRKVMQPISAIGDHGSNDAKQANEIAEETTAEMRGHFANAAFGQLLSFGTVVAVGMIYNVHIVAVVFVFVCVCVSCSCSFMLTFLLPY
jgi:hypothetical protein